MNERDNTWYERIMKGEYFNDKFEILFVFIGVIIQIENFVEKLWG